MKISVVMPCFLGEYQGAASNREEKLIRAIDSFLAQDYDDKELIIVSDGCKITTKLVVQGYKDYFNNNMDRIALIVINKEPLFSGRVRDVGLSHANGVWVCYLDSDDELGSTHLSSLANQIEYSDWVYWDDTIKGNGHDHKRDVQLYPIQCGTSTIAHRRDMKSDWADCNGYGHDFKFITKLIQESGNYAKINDMQYFVRHMPGNLDT